MQTNYSNYRSSHQKTKAKWPFSKTEATATLWLQDHIFCGVGPRHLGWRFPVYEVLPDLSEMECEKAGPRVWKTPPKEERYKWRPLLDHLRTNYRGLVANGSSHVSFITTELDRHSGDVQTARHIQEVMATGRLLKGRFYSACGFKLKWCVEVNKRNGSVKFFGWGNCSIPIETAKKIGEQIEEVLTKNGLWGSKREVFPYNHGQVLLPMRWDKKTIIDTGVLPLCTRKCKDDDTGKMDAYRTYSVVNFCEWLQRGGHFCERTLLETLTAACANLPDEMPRAVAVASTPEPVEEAPSGRMSCRYTGKAADNPNSFERQHSALLEFCRRMKRVVSEREALAYIKTNKLYTGKWKENVARRRARVQWILKRIAQTFDPTKCQGVRHDVQVGKYDNWARSFIGTIKGRDRRTLDEYGNGVVRESRYRVDWRFVSMFLSVVEFCLKVSPNDDGSLPQVRAEDIWTRCYEGGQTKVPFCEKKWAICRDWLDKQGIIKIVDRNWCRGKAMRWAVGERFEHLPEWWRREKKPSLLEAVPLVEFLGNRNREQIHSLNTYRPSGGSKAAVDADKGPTLVRPPP